MSEPKLISPLLANHIMGEPISAHHGVRCCPAILKDSDNKYIVKIISIPASSVQLDALLLSGAYATQEDALKYFKELADAVVEEARLLQKLSRLEGFYAYPSWQVEPMEDGTGYDVYLLGDYKMTLERYLRRNSLTHLAAVNLGLDLCAALSVCRRSGYLYVDLKPENIFITDHNEYRIADLGFISLRSLKYASLPDKYRSSYTAPEITDAYSSLNTTLDIYAVGLILYQAFNDGKLPSSEGDLLPPAYADYEMAEIILKAIAPNPEDRWEDPQQMGQALVSYMQRNSVNDTPIVPVPDIPTEEASADSSVETETIPEDTEAASEEVTPAAEEPEIEAAAVEEISEAILAVEESKESSSGSESQMEDNDDFEEPFNVEVVDLPIDLSILTKAAPAEEIPTEEEAAPAEESSAAEETFPEEAPVPAEDAPAGDAESVDEAVDDPEQFIIDGFDLDETHPGDADAEVLTVSISDEVGDILAQADELIAHQAPDPVVAPEPVEIPMPDPILPEKEKDEENTEEDTDEGSEEDRSSEEASDETEASAEVSEEAEQDDSVIPEPTPKDGPKKKKLRGLIGTLISILLALVILAGGFWFYENYYLQHIYSFELDSSDDDLIITLDTQIDNELLTVYLTDVYGNKLHSAVVNNQATFTDLPSGTTYTISATIEGFHKLICATGASYTTPTETNIVSFTAIAADTDGSVILNFSVQGPDNTNWYVKYSTEGEEEKTALCTGHMVTITGLTVGSEYTFRLVPEAELYVVGNEILTYTALPVIYPEELTIHGFDKNVMKVTWTAPEDIAVNSWTVRCYNSDGFDTTFTVTEPMAYIEVPDSALGYTVDVKAEGMSVSKWTSVSAGSITFNSVNYDESVPGQVTLSWEYEGAAPEDGWMLMYTVDGSEKYIVQSESASCTISPLIPGGVYSISFILSDDVTVFGGNLTYTALAAETFDAYGVTADQMTFTMCPTPEETDWIWYDVWTGYYTNTFTSGETASLIVALDGTREKSTDEIPTLFVVKNSEGIPISIVEGRCRSWNSMWIQNHTEFDLPVTPTTPGEYTVDIYFAHQYVTTESFSIISEPLDEVTDDSAE